MGCLSLPGQVPYLSTGAGNKSLLVLFFRKEQEERMFFSEEKNQKTFSSAWVERYGTWPGGES
jgi:hypothetical protein